MGVNSPRFKAVIAAAVLIQGVAALNNGVAKLPGEICVE